MNVLMITFQSVRYLYPNIFHFQEQEETSSLTLDENPSPAMMHKHQRFMDFTQTFESEIEAVSNF